MIFFFFFVIYIIYLNSLRPIYFEYCSMMLLLLLKTTTTMSWIWGTVFVTVFLITGKGGGHCSSCQQMCMHNLLINMFCPFLFIFTLNRNWFTGYIRLSDTSDVNHLFFFFHRLKYFFWHHYTHLITIIPNYMTIFLLLSNFS